MRFVVALSLPSFFWACAAGPNDIVENGHDVRDAGAPHGAYVYAAKRPLVAIGLAEATNVSESDAHRAVDSLAESAAACFKRAKNLAQGAARITIPIDEGGVVGVPDVTISPQEATGVGMLCLLAPLRMTSFSPSSSGDAGAQPRSLTIESAWGP
ncbi:MAG TPA: hypothetical protein VH054_06540 [Polyangiaceae bacterium]|nr:hypothetical protein [Polyangiaceae bacterium]